MNKIIEDLAHEANIFASELEGLGGTYGGNRQEVENFAKLIVRDCCATILMTGYDTDGWDSSGFLLYKSPEDLVKVLREKYGI